MQSTRRVGLVDLMRSNKDFEFPTILFSNFRFDHHPSRHASESSVNASPRV